MSELELVYNILVNGGSTGGTILIIYAVHKFINRKNNSKPLSKTDLELRVTQQEGECRDRYYKAIKETENKIIEAIKNNGRT
jgi:hypothetical protein